MTADIEKELINEQEIPTVEQAEPQGAQGNEEAEKNNDKQTTQEAAKAENPVEKLEAEKAELNDRLLRVVAEFDNFRKRTQREKESTYGDAQGALITELLPVIDNFERALQSECTDEGFKKGVEMIYTSIMQNFEKNGVQSFGKPGDIFDPNMHHAVMHIEDDSFEENSIVEVFQKGYKMGERVLRCAMVKTAN